MAAKARGGSDRSLGRAGAACRGAAPPGAVCSSAQASSAAVSDRAKAYAAAVEKAAEEDGSSSPYRVVKPSRRPPADKQAERAGLSPARPRAGAPRAPDTPGDSPFKI